MRDGVRDKVNINIDSRLKRLFEDLQETHGKSWTVFLEESVKELLVEIGSVEMLEYLIKTEDEKQAERRLALMRAKENVSVLGPTQKVDAEIEKKREEQFQKDIKWLPKMISRGDKVNWNRIFFDYYFESKKEAMEWFRPRVERWKELQKS